MKALRRFAVVLIAVLTLCVGALVFTACNKKSVTLSFETNGGTQIEAVSVPAGSEYEGPQTPIKDGFTFGGWYDNAEFSGDKISFPVTVPKKNTTYYANWTGLPKITLDLNGGTLGAGTELALAAGERVYDFMSAYTPVFGGLTFDGWYNGNNPLLKTTRMPAEGLTLTARWLVGYTVEIYTQTDGGSFEKTDTRTGEGAYNQVLTFTTGNAPAIDHYTLTENGNAVSSMTLKQNASQNLFKLYYQRETVLLTFSANLPDGATATGETAPVEAPYGSLVDLPACGFNVNGYRFAGWSTTSTNPSHVYAVGEQVAVRSLMYAVWDHGYTDRLDGQDIVYISSVDGTVAYLQRDKLAEKIGSYDATTKTFTFNVDDGSLLNGTISNDYTFAYLRTSEIAGTYVFSNSYYNADYNDSVGATDETVTLVIDDYMTATLTEKGATAADDKVYAGTLTARNNGEYTFSYNDGENAVQEIIRLLTEGEANYFERRGTEAGQYYQFTVGNASLQGSIDQSATYTLDGYGNATMTVGNGSLNGIYYREPAGDGDTEASFPVYQLIFFTAKGNVSRTREVILNRTQGSNSQSILICKDYSTELKLERDEEKLVLDGFNGLRSATYTNRFGTVSGHYAETSSILYPNDTVIHFISSQSSAAYYFRITEGSFELIGDTGYAELRYILLDGNLQIANMVLTQDTVTGDAKLYYASATGADYELIATGRYASADDLDLKTLYRFTVNSDGFVKGNGLIEKNFVFGIESQIALTSGSYIQGFYVYGFIENVQGQDRVVEARYKTYTDLSGNRIITNEVFYGASYLSAQGTSFSAQWTENEDVGPFHQHILRLTVSSGQSVYFVLSGDTFTELQLPYGYHYEYDAIDRTYSTAAILYLSGDGRVVYQEIVEGETVTIATGTYGPIGTDTVLTFTDIAAGYENRVNAEIHVFIGTVSTSSSGTSTTYQVFMRRDEETPRTLTSVSEGTLEIDGYQTATLKTGATSTTGTYRFTTAEKDTLLFTVSGRTTTYDITKDGDDWTFARHVDEVVETTDGREGTYYFYAYSAGAISESNQSDAILYGKIDETRFIVLDGKGGATYTVGGKEYVGTYEYNGAIVLTVTIDGVETEISAVLNPSPVGATGVYVELLPDYEELFFNDAWQVLSISNANSAYFIDERGVRTSGIYAIRSDNYVFIKASEATGIYRIDRTNHSFAAAEADADGFLIDGNILIKYTGENTDVTLPSAIKTISPDAFYGTQVVSVDLANVETIGNLAFYDVQTLKSVTGGKITYIAHNAFARADGGVALTVNLTTDGTAIPRMGNNVFANVDYTIVVNTRDLAQTLYAESDWVNYRAGIATRDNVTDTAHYGTWYAPDFSVVVIGKNADVNSFHGVYEISGTNVTVYGATGSIALTLAADDATVTYQEKTFNRYTADEKVTLKNGGETLTFTPTGSAAFSVEGKYVPEEGAVEETVIVNVSYENEKSPVTFLRNGGFTYTVTVTSLADGEMSAKYEYYYTSAIYSISDWIAQVNGVAGNGDSLTLIQTSFDGKLAANGSFGSIQTENGKLYFEEADTVYAGTTTLGSYTAQTYRITVNNSTDKHYDIPDGDGTVSYSGDGRIYEITVYRITNVYLGSISFFGFAIPQYAPVAFTYSWYSYSTEGIQTVKTSDGTYSIKTYHYIDGSLGANLGAIVDFDIYAGETLLNFDYLRSYSDSEVSDDDTVRDALYVGVILDGDNAGRYTITATPNADGKSIKSLTVEKTEISEVTVTTGNVSIVYNVDLDGNIVGIHRVTENGETLYVFQVLWRDSTHEQMLVFCTASGTNGEDVTRRFIVHVEKDGTTQAETPTRIETLADTQTVTTADGRFQANVLLDENDDVIVVWLAMQNADKDGYGTSVSFSGLVGNSGVYTYKISLTEINGAVNVYNVTVTVTDGTVTLTVELD